MFLKLLFFISKGKKKKEKVTQTQKNGVEIFY